MIIVDGCEFNVNANLKGTMRYCSYLLNLEMAIKRTHHEGGTYFCTFTCLQWQLLIETTNLYDHIYQWFNLLTKAGHQITGFVIMPNHVHLLLHVNGSEATVNKILGNGKRFMAYEIVKRLKAANHTDLLAMLAENVSPEERTRKKKHRVFEPSSDIKLCYSEKFIIQKLEYMHANPIAGKWNLAFSAADYPHSSASYYELNREHSYTGDSA
jgi:REP element-mobilizing transposase RayT